MFYLISIDDGRPRPCDIPEEKFAAWAQMNQHVIHFVVEDEKEE
jgi:hypothetical protein